MEIRERKLLLYGQTYFAIQTRRQEVVDYFNQLDEDNKRLVIRGDIKQWNKMLRIKKMRMIQLYCWKNSKKSNTRHWWNYARRFANT